jgi:anti-sigma factor RsiW
VTTASEIREADQMQCKQLIQLVTDYLEGTIAEAEREQMEAHMGECKWCGRYIEQTRQVIDALGELDPQRGDSEAWANALAAFREHQNH